LSQQELCNRSFRDKPSITRLVDNLERQRLVRRVSSRTDRRMNMIHLTEAGRELQVLTITLADRTLNEALEGVSPADIELCKGVLQQVYDNLK